VRRAGRWVAPLIGLMAWKSLSTSIHVNWTLPAFLDALREAGVVVVLDVRQRRGVRGSEYAWANAGRLQEESARAGLDGLVRLPHPARVRTPLLILGAADDGAVTQDEVRATARAYGTQAHFFPSMGHNMMLEAGWGDVAQRIDSWLLDLGL